VADFDAVTPEPAVRPDAFTAPADPQPAERDPEEPARMAEPEENLHEAESLREAERAVPRRSTVREKVSFLSEPPSVATASAEPSESPPAAPAPDEPAAPESSETQPRRAGWWSRRFGGE
jgi:ribonuclease E